MKRTARASWSGIKPFGARGLCAAVLALSIAAQGAAQIRFRHQPIPFTLENGESVSGPRYTPATMAGGVAAFDCDGDGNLDLYFTNGAELPSLKKTSERHWNRLFLNDGKGSFTDATRAAGLQGTGYDTGVAVADYDNDGHKDLFVAGVHRNTLYRNNGDCTFTDVTSAAGLDRPDPKYGPLWAVAGAFLDFDNDGRLDLFVVNYLSWAPEKEPSCPGYCHPKYYEGLPNQLFRNNGDGTFTDVSAESGIRRHAGKGMGAAIADFDRDGLIDIFVTNDKAYNYFFWNRGGGKFVEKAFDFGVALAEHALEVSGMGADFRDFDNDGLPDIVFVALDNETFPLFRNTGTGMFREATNATGLAFSSKGMAGYGPGLFDFDNDGWKDLFVSRGHVQSPDMSGKWTIDQANTVFRNIEGRKFAALTEEAGFTAVGPKRHRGVAFGDLNGDGLLDAVVTALKAPAEIWLNESSGGNRWLALDLEGAASNRDGIGAEIKVTTALGAQYNHVTTSVGYASSSAGPAHFGLGAAESLDAVEIRWPSGRRQTIKAPPTGQVLKVREPGN
ncbi:MAG: CRTAC1 family protein [Bryobacteraceae bacterium]|nr:CRTAC1 family protein [Bryobacteraceae bacterium]